MYRNNAGKPPLPKPPGAPINWFREMAHLLAKLGEAALKPQKFGSVWRKAAISAKNAARLRKEWLLEGK